MRFKTFAKVTWMSPLFLLWLLPIQQVLAASCCGGGGGASLVIPKYNYRIVNLSLAEESYDGFWNSDGKWVSDPPGSDMRQYRLSAGIAQRLSDNLQVSASLPVVFNRNTYSRIERNSQGLGDSSVNLWYEFFDAVTCTYRVRSLADLRPAVYWGLNLVVPTGVSPYDEVKDNFDITGRGFYRLDNKLLVEKTVYPWGVSLSYSYGIYLERPVNTEYGQAVAPYHKKLGDRQNLSLGAGYTWFLPSLDAATATLTMSQLKEDAAEVDGKSIPGSSIEKRSVSLAGNWSTNDKAWSTTLSLSHSPTEDNWGQNFPATNTISLSVQHVLE